jgi:anti-sigma28 factor (negative regulator of flagellin synthesis)
MNIPSIGPNTPIQKITAKPVHVSLPAKPAAATKLTDRVELSHVNKMLATLKANDIRADKVQTIRAAIDAGTYETEAKLDAAIDKLLNDLT